MHSGSEFWRSLFERWPTTLPRQALLVTVFQETIPFVDFLVGTGGLIVERDRPDSHGGRKIVIAYEAISAVKFTDPGVLARFQPLGFEVPG